LPPGWHPWYWPFIYDIEFSEVVEIEQGTVAMLTASDGEPLPQGATYAPSWAEGTETDMAQDAEYFLGEGGGYRGPQSSVLSPGKYRINPKLFKIKTTPVLSIEKAQVGVVKSNVGTDPVPGTGDIEAGERKLVDLGQRGIWRTPLVPDQYYAYSHTDAYQVTNISTKKHIVLYTSRQGPRSDTAEEREIMVRTSDGFTFPVDVRVEFEIHPQDAPLLVATVGDDQEGLRTVMDSAVRAIFRNNAEGVKALDYVKQRSHQESQSETMLKEELKNIGVTITAVRIGDVGNEETLGTLLKTQTDREIALQEQETFNEQQRAAQQKKELTRTEQEAEEEKRLATASYAVKISEQEKLKQVIAAGAEAESIEIKAEAQANAYKLIAEQIGSNNAALLELLKVVGERNIQITPRVMVTGGNGGGGEAQSTALIGTMLDSMIEESAPQTRPAAPRAGQR
jgi:regulator of protease activity HflC (stomatin/prohibitin superfamily)